MVWVTWSPSWVPSCSVLQILSLKLHSNLSLFNIHCCCLQPNCLFPTLLKLLPTALLRVLTVEVYLSNIKSRMLSKIDTEYCHAYYLLYWLYTKKAHKPQHDFPRPLSLIPPVDTPALVFTMGTSQPFFFYVQCCWDKHKFNLSLWSLFF